MNCNTMVNDEDESRTHQKCQMPRRYLVLMMSMLAVTIVHLLRLSINIALFEMTRAKRVELDNGTTVIVPAEYILSDKLIFHIKTSYLYGYIPTCVFGGYMASQVGGHIIMGLSGSVASVITMLTPVLTKFSIYALLATHFATGFSLGAVAPCTMNIVARWFPYSETSTAVSGVASGGQLASIIGISWSGFLGNYLGWESIFYSAGLVSMIWTVCWFIFVSRYPTDDKYLTEEELRKIVYEGNSLSIFNRVKPPWKSFLLSKPLWGAIVGNICMSWGHLTITTELVKFLKDVLSFELDKAGVISIVPFYVTFATTFLSGYLADKVISMGLLTVTHTRKFFYSVALLLDAIYLVGLASWRDIVSMMVCLIFAGGIKGFVFASFPANHLDMAPEYASVTFAVSAGLASLTLIINPLVTDYLVKNNPDTGWSTVFYLTAGVNCVGILIYLLFSSGEKQPWAHS